MNERETWLFLASLWDKPINYDNHPTRVYCEVKGRKCTGICFQLLMITTHNQISESVWHSMTQKIREEAISLDREGYLWPTNAAGAIERAAFCRRMAAL